MENRKYLVIDFGGTLTKYSVMDEETNIYHKGEKKSPVEGKEEFLSFITELIKEVSNIDKISGVALSMPGVIDAQNGILISAGSFVNLYGLNVFEELKDRVLVPISIENDGKCGALAEVWKGNLEDCKDGIVLIIGTGVAGGIIKARRIHKGKHLSAGEFSYIFMDEKEGFQGTVLTKCGIAPLLFDTTRELGIDIKRNSEYSLCSLFMNCEQTLSELNDLPKYANGLDGYAFFELLEEGNSVVKRHYETYVNNLSRLIMNLSTIYDPERILIGGGVSRQKRLIDDVKKRCNEINETLMGMYKIPFDIDVCKYENDANQYGALYHFLTSQCKQED